MRRGGKEKWDVGNFLFGWGPKSLFLRGSQISIFFFVGYKSFLEGEGSDISMRGIKKF